MKNIILLGCQKITIDILNFLKKKKNINISLVITYDLTQDYALSGINIKDFCIENNIKTIVSKSINKDLEDLIRSNKPDLIISSYFRGIIKKRVWASSKVATINIHPSILPFYRGPTPTAWGLLKLEKVFGVTIHKINDTIDGGDIYAQKKYLIKKNETGYELYNRAMRYGYLLFKENFDKILNDKIKAKKQKQGGSYYGKMNDFDFIDWKKTSAEIEALVRIRAKPYNVAQARVYNKNVFINKVKILKNKYLIQKPGQIIKVNKDSTFIVSTANGCILVQDFFIYPEINKESIKKVFIKKGAIFNNY
jgi:methionyl-tRNA formyltransferase